MDIVPEPSWEELAAGFIERKGSAIIIGATDSGKSSLVRFLTNRLVSASVPVCLVDADIGQSSLGLPGTISMRTFTNDEDLKDFTFERMSFVGMLNPAKEMAFITSTTKRLCDACGEDSQVTLIDTSGLISGGVGKALKIAKINASRPGYVIALQREDEVEHILESIEGPKVYRFKTSKFASVRRTAGRAAYRKRKFEQYFESPRMSSFLLYPHEVEVFYKSRPFSPRRNLFYRGTIIGLNHDEETLALGILDELTDKAITFSSPVKSLKKINRVVFGDIAF